MKTFLISCAYMKKYYYFESTEYRRKTVIILLQPDYRFTGKPL